MGELVERVGIERDPAIHDKCTPCFRSLPMTFMPTAVPLPTWAELITGLTSEGLGFLFFSFCFGRNPKSVKIQVFEAEN